LSAVPSIVAQPNMKSPSFLTSYVLKCVCASVCRTEWHMGTAGPGGWSAQLAQACIADYALGLGPKVTSSTIWNRISPT